MIRVVWAHCKSENTQDSEINLAMMTVRHDAIRKKFQSAIQGKFSALLTDSIPKMQGAVVIVRPIYPIPSLLSCHSEDL